ncbi:MAG: HAMP domain-containing histidine kinase [Ruminococcus sp.]|nr:MAG: HAMP domain-containing histidine kinase [Ruminococcus sp.]
MCYGSGERPEKNDGRNRKDAGRCHDRLLFLKPIFDESQLSALETKFAHHLSAAEASSQKHSAGKRQKSKTLIADISHQTKTPIANLLLYSELLMEETMPASAKANVEALYKQSEKAAISDRFSRKSFPDWKNGIISLSPQQAALQPLLESVVEQYTAKASEKKDCLCKCRIQMLFAVFDFKWTAEALANIVDNAIKYTEHGTIRISAVSYEMFARIDISDTGSGIPETEQAKIFARFYRSKAVQEQEGVGIGLYLARQIISGEGGYIKIASVPGKGSTFFHISAEITTILSKTVRFHFSAGKNVEKIPMR